MFNYQVAYLALRESVLTILDGCDERHDRTVRERLDDALNEAMNAGVVSPNNLSKSNDSQGVEPLLIPLKGGALCPD